MAGHKAKGLFSIWRVHGHRPASSSGVAFWMQWAPLLVALVAVALWHLHGTAEWTAAQTIRSLWPLTRDRATAASHWSVADRLERRAWDLWTAPHTPHPTAPIPIPVVTSLDRTGIDFSRPFIFRGLLNGSDVLDWGPDFFSAPPYGDVTVDFFPDARRVGTVPEGRAPLREIARNITAGGPQKFATEVVFRKFPDLLASANLSFFPKLFGFPLNVAAIGSTLTAPLFFARGSNGTTTRTDLHCEPIANVVLMVTGSKRWLLLPPSQSWQLDPRISPDGRAYIVSSLHPTHPRVSTLQRYEVIAEAGDVLWVPAWTWHRVDYLPGIASLSVGLFHFRPWDFLRHNPLFAATVIPNLLKEYAGLKAQ